MSLFDSLGLLAPGAPADGIFFPEIDPGSNTIVNASLTVDKARTILRRHVLVPAGLPNGAKMTLRSIRSVSSTDAAISGVADPDRLAQGGWKSSAGAASYLDRALAMLSRPSLG